MADSRWRRIEALFEEASSLGGDERAAFLSRACGEDHALRREVESLLAADEKSPAFLDRPAVSVAEPAAPRPSLVGRRVGPYRIEAQIGEGGMSAVYRATRADDAYQHEVALKVLRYEADRPDLAARFRAERQILAALDHPGIARLLDGGTTEDGRPYLVMEHIGGAPLDRYCDEHRLDLDARVDLVRRVCEAVQYAHQNLVVHRDIKPSNILVGADGVPRLLDFGIAKLLDGAALPGAVEATVTGQRLMTPHYASPEQVEGAAITTATDVYALGVLLYVLLTGRLPYVARGTSSEALQRAILEQEPERPSTSVGRTAPAAMPSGAVADSGATQDALCEARGLRPAQLRRKLRGDLDNIVLMALRKEPERRYASVAHLSEDLRRYREGLPVAAQPDTLGYRTRKFVGRHRAAVGAAAGAVTVILVLAVTMTVQAARLAHQRDQIRAERDKAIELAQLLEGLFAGSDPGESRGESMTARELLDKGAERAMAELDGQPETQASLAIVIGRVYESLGLVDRAGPLFQRSLDLRRELHGRSHPAIAESLRALALLDQSRGDLPAAEAKQREALAMIREGLGEQDRMVADVLNDLSTTLIGQARYPQAESTLREALAISRRIHGDVHETVAGGLANLGSVLRKSGKLEEAEAAQREALAIGRKVFGEVHPKLGRQLNNLAVLLVDRGELEEAERLSREALAISRKLYGDAHPDIALQLNNLGSILAARGDHPEAILVGEEGLAMRRGLFGPDHEQVAMSLVKLADTLEDMGASARARALYDEALCIQQSALGPGHPRNAAVLDRLADIELAGGDRGAAEALAREAVELRRAALGESHADFGASLVTLGSVLAASGDAQAGGLLRRGRDVLARALPSGHWRIADAESRLGAHLALQGDGDAGRLLVDGYEGLLRERGPRSARTAAALARLVASQSDRAR